jgi:hypothetical protein
VREKVGPVAEAIDDEVDEDIDEVVTSENEDVVDPETNEPPAVKEEAELESGKKK